MIANGLLLAVMFNVPVKVKFPFDFGLTTIAQLAFAASVAPEQVLLVITKFVAFVADVMAGDVALVTVVVAPPITCEIDTAKAAEVVVPWFVTVKVTPAPQYIVLAAVQVTVSWLFVPSTFMALELVGEITRLTPGILIVNGSHAVPLQYSGRLVVLL